MGDVERGIKWKRAGVVCEARPGLTSLTGGSFPGTALGSAWNHPSSTGGTILSADPSPSPGGAGVIKADDGLGLSPTPGTKGSFGLTPPGRWSPVQAAAPGPRCGGALPARPAPELHSSDQKEAARVPRDKATPRRAKLHSHRPARGRRGRQRAAAEQRAQGRQTRAGRRPAAGSGEGGA